MPLSRKIRIISVIAILGLLTFIIVYFFQGHRNQDLKNLKQDFKLRNEQAEELKNVHLDSARSCAYHAYQLVREEPSLEFEKNVAILTLSEIKFLQFGASDRRYNRVEKCEKWFRDHKFYDEAFRANLLRLEIKSFLKGDEAVREKADELINLAKSSKSDKALAQAYYFKMQKRDYSRKWEDDVYLLDSARILANKINDSVLLAKIRLTSVLPINGKAASFDSTFLCLEEAIRWNSKELICLSYESLGREFMPKRNMKDSAIYYLDKGVEIARSWKSKTHESNAQLNKVSAYIYSSDLDSAIRIGKSAVNQLKEVGNRSNELRLHRSLAQALFSKEEFSKGISHAQKMLQIAEEMDDEMAIYTSKQVLSTYLIRSERYDEAEIFALEMYEWAKTRKKTKVNALIISNVLFLNGKIKMLQSDLDSAYHYYREAAEKLEGQTGWNRFYVQSSVLSVLLQKKDYSKALEHYNYLISEYTNTYLLQPNFMRLKGELMYGLGNDQEAVTAMNDFLVNDKNGGKKVHYRVRIMLTEIYEKQGRYGRALENNKEALSLKHEMDKGEDALKLEKVQSKYELSQKETKIQKLDKYRLRQKNSLDAQERKLEIRWLSIISLSILLVLLGIIIVFIYNRAKQARIREELKRVALEKERHIELIKAEESRRTIELKSQLFANISHEFRTPLTLIQAPVEELMEKADDENKNSLKIVKRNADHLLVMVDEILELAKLDSGNTTLSRKEIRLESFILNLQGNFKPVFRQNNIQLETNLPTENYTLIADEYRLKMVLNNILKNAFHHTPKDGLIKVNATVNFKEERFEMSIFNSGDWIDAAFLPTIFERYSRSKEKEYSGYGIGLSFCKQIISLHGGGIKVENADGGVLVSFTIPSKISEIESNALEETGEITEASVMDESQLKEQKLLIVEDNLEMQSLLNDLLREEFDLMFANNGQEGIEIAEQNQPDLIISDIMMPKVGGIELASTLKDNFSTSHIPIILLTAKSAGHDRIAGLETGADDYLTKPFSPRELRVRVRNLIEQRELLRKRFSKNVFLVPDEITSNSLDQEFLVKATEIVESNLQTPEFNVEQFCQELALNRNSVHQKLKSLTGSSASQFIKSIKLKKAAIFLADERISITEVYEISGFNNRQTFNESFKGQFEMTPSDYRKKCLIN